MIPSPSPSPNTLHRHRHRLKGCSPRPLGAYLKALGVLRIVAEQKDPEARGYWENDAFVLVTRLDEEALLEFFLWEWMPNPFVSPWNKGSGLLETRDKAVQPVADSTALRFSLLREGLASVRLLTEEMEEAVLAEKAIKNEAKKIKDKSARALLEEDPEYQRRLEGSTKKCKRLKDELQPDCQRRWRGPALRWLRVALVISADGQATFPALLGTGGNDGRLDFTNNAMQRLGDLFDLASAEGAPQESAARSLRAALWGGPAPVLVGGGIGQFSPLASGGANSSSGALGHSLLNPWDLPLLLEGSLLFTAGSSRRLGGAASERTVAPFSAVSLSAGYGSASPTDKGARGEQWMPLWTRPWTAAEVGALLAEGRCQLGTRSAATSMEVARAVARLGVARGVEAFERYGYIERNGKSNYAVPLGRWSVRAEPHACLLDDLGGGNWWEKLRRATEAKSAPASLIHLSRRLNDGVMGALAHGGHSRWQGVLILLAEVEAQLVASGAFTVEKCLQPLPPLSPAWMTAVDDGGPELPLALALAGAGIGHDAEGGVKNGVRRHWWPLDPFGRFATKEKALVKDPRVVVTGREAEEDLIRLAQRRILEGMSSTGRPLPLRPRFGTAARLDDVMTLLRGEVDLERTLWLARGFAAMNWGAPGLEDHLPRRSRSSLFPIDPIWASLRLCHLAGPLEDGRELPVDPAVLRLLASGDPPRAFSLVMRRLRSAGVPLPLRRVVLEPRLARLMAASLAFPISRHDTTSLVRELDPPNAPPAQETSHVR